MVESASLSAAVIFSASAAVSLSLLLSAAAGVDADRPAGARLPRDEVASPRAEVPDGDVVMLSPEDGAPCPDWGETNSDPTESPAMLLRSLKRRGTTCLTAMPLRTRPRRSTLVR